MAHQSARRWRRTTLAVVGWLTVTIGVLHCVVTYVGYKSLSLEALWFAGTGVAIMLMGALSLLARADNVAVRSVATAGNAAGVLLALAFNSLTGWGQLQGLVLLALFVVGSLAAFPDRR